MKSVVLARTVLKTFKIFLVILISSITLIACEKGSDITKSDSKTNPDPEPEQKTVYIQFNNRTSKNYQIEIELSGSILARKTLGTGQMYSFSRNCSGTESFYYSYRSSDNSGNGSGTASCGGKYYINIQ